MSGLVQRVEMGDVTVIEVWRGAAFAEQHGMAANVVGAFVASCLAHGVYANAPTQEVALGLPPKCIEWCGGCAEVVKQFRAEREAALERERLEREAAAAKAYHRVFEHSPLPEPIFSPAPEAAPPEPQATEASALVTPAAPAAAPVNGSGGPVVNGTPGLEAVWVAAWGFKERIEALEGELAGTRDLLSNKLAELPAETRLLPYMRDGKPFGVRARGERFYITPLKIPTKKGGK